MVQDHLKEQSEADSQSESTSSQSQRDLVASRRNHSRRRRTLDRANVRHLGRIKGFIQSCNSVFWRRRSSSFDFIPARRARSTRISNWPDTPFAPVIASSGNFF